MILYISLLYGVIYIEGTVEINLINICFIMIFISYSTTAVILYISLLYGVIYIAGIVEINLRDSGYTNILQDKTLFCAFDKCLRPVVLSADWSIRRLQSWTCSRLPTFAEFVKLAQSIVIEIQRQSADLYKVQLFQSIV